VRRPLGYGAKILAQDGSWARACRVVDVSQTGARLAMEEPVGLSNNFILALSERGKAVRRCRLVWASGSEIGVKFEQAKATP